MAKVRTTGYGPRNPTHSDWRERSQRDIAVLLRDPRNCTIGFQALGLKYRHVSALAKKYNVHHGNIVQQELTVLREGKYKTSGPSREDEIKARKETQRF